MIKWWLVVVIGMVIVWWVWSTMAYFEDAYWCNVWWTSIEVSLSTGDQLCLSYFKWITQLLVKTNQDLETAINNSKVTSWYDKVYRDGIVATLLKKKDDMLVVQQELTSALKDFEKELFVRVKSIIGYYLLPRATELSQKIAQGKKLLHRLMIAGDMNQYVFARQQMQSWEYEMMFLDRMQQASTFDVLLPPLKQRMREQKLIKN